MSEVESAPAVAAKSLPLRLNRLLHRRATWVLVDQGIVSAGNFLTANQLVRFLPKSEYGVFAILLETMLYLNSLQAALVVYPLTIQGATGGGAALRRLGTASIFFTLLMLPLLGGATIAASGALDHWSVGISAVVALVLWQLQETVRRGLMADLRFTDVIWGDGISYLGQAGCIFALAMLERLSLQSTFLVMGATSAVAIVVQSMQIGIRPVRLVHLRVIAMRFWRLGRWMLLNNATSAVTSLGYWWVLKWWHGVDAAAVFGAIVALFKLANPVMSSMSGLIMPAVARANEQSGWRAAARMAIRYMTFGAALLAPYFLALAIAPRPLMRLFYGSNSEYAQYSLWLSLYVANYSAAYLSMMIAAWLAGLGHSRFGFYAQVVNLIASLLVGLPMTARWGVPGLILGGMVATVLNAAVAVWFIRYSRTH